TLVQRPTRWFQIVCSSQLRPPKLMFFLAPFDAVDVVPNFHAQRSPFSPPSDAYQPLPNGSVTVSLSSCAMMFAIASAGDDPFGPVACASQPPDVWCTRQYVGSPMKP